MYKLFIINFMEKIVTHTLHHEVVKRIREMIRSGDLRRGQKIDEKSLSESMGVSRTPIREALRILHSEGLIHLMPQRGAWVSQPRIEDIQDMFDVMSTLEGMCARLAAEKITPQALKKIETLHERLEKHYRAWDHKGYLDNNEEFHLFIQELAGNKVLNETIKGLRRKILLYRHEQLYHLDRFHESIAEHRQIMDALRNKDVELAETFMKRHLLNQGKALFEVYSRSDTPS